MKKQEGLRFNNGKTRIGLIPPFAIEQIARILTYGAHKYTIPSEGIVGDNNWRNGMDWSRTLDSLERHLNKFKSCIDNDEETGMLHIAHVAVNAMFLTEFYKIAPEKDDRWRRPMPRIGLDVDEVLADFKGGFNKHHNVDIKWHSWYSSYRFSSLFEKIKNDTGFWMNLAPLINPDDMKFEPVCYVTSRPVENAVTENWIELNGFPTVPVVTVGRGESKVGALKKYGVDVFIDDKYETFRDVNSAGIACYLMDQPHNQRFDVGYRRIRDINQVLDFEDSPITTSRKDYPKSTDPESSLGGIAQHYLRGRI